MQLISKLQLTLLLALRLEQHNYHFLIFFCESVRIVVTIKNKFYFFLFVSLFISIFKVFLTLFFPLFKIDSKKTLSYGIPV